MFEDPLARERKGHHNYWIDMLVVAGILVLLIGYRVFTKGPAKEHVRTASAAADVSTADPVKDLKIERATMQKDSIGATAVWSVRLINKSDKFTYTAVGYQTDYMGGDNRILLENKGTIATTIGPNSEGSFEIRDVAYPVGTAWYNFKVIAAKAKIE